MSRAPQVRIVNGQIVLDVNSLQVDRTARDNDTLEQVEYVEENPLERTVNSRTYSKHIISARWDAPSTELFYQGLSQWGTDFEMISSMFPSRTRRQIKNKFTIEERRNPVLVTQALIRKQPVDMEEYARTCETTFRPIAELEEELEQMKARFEAERQEAIKEAESKTAQIMDEVPASSLNADPRKRARLRRADEGIEVVGTIEEVEAQEAAEAARRIRSSDDEGDT